MRAPRPTASPRRHRPVATGRDRGSVSIQMVTMLPLLFTVMFLGMQGALYYHARTVAIAAAQEGARVAGSEGGTGSEGAAAATGFVADAGGDGVIRSATVSSQRSATTATVTVRGTAMSVIPGWALAINQSAAVPVERITR